LSRCPKIREELKFSIDIRFLLPNSIKKKGKTKKTEEEKHQKKKRTNNKKSASLVWIA